MTGATFYGNQTHTAMKNAFRLLLLALLPLFFFSACKGGGDMKEQVAAVDALHPFEGVMRMTTTMPGTGSAAMTIHIGKEGILTETETTLAGLSGHMPVRVLSLNSAPDRIYMLNDAAKTYMEFDTAAVPAADSADAAVPFKDAVVEQLGTETVNGYRCSHIRISSIGSEEAVEMWLNPDLPGYFTYARMQASGRESVAALAAKLKAEGIDGFPVRALHVRSGIVTDLVSVDRMAPDPAMFAIPAGYTKTDMPDMGKGVLSGESLEKMKEAAEQMQQQLMKR